MGQGKWAALGLVVVVVLAGAGVFLTGAWPFGGEVEQPLAFPHDVHAGENDIPCMYCHFSADISSDAGIPSVEVCAGCHIPAGVPMIATDNPEVQKLIAAWKNQEPIRWVRIHDLPDHVHFPHMMHINAGLDCQTCHGQVAEMEQVEQVASLEMGWCIDCHTDPPEEVQQAGIESARIDCFVCHY